MTTFYDGAELESTVLDALRAAGRPSDPIDSDDLAGLDEFHAVGRAGTLALAELAHVMPRERVLDVGAGIGGPSRALARHFGAQVTALDPTPRFCRLARLLTARCELGDQVTIVEADARSMPFTDDSFDLVWTQALWQSIEDKPAVSAEIHRVLRPGGRLAMFEVVGDGNDLHYPVPWADDSGDSFVVSSSDLRATLNAAGLVATEWRTGADAQAALVAAAGSPQMKSGVPGIGLDLLLPDYEARMGGLARNVEDGRITLVMGLLTADG